MQMLADRLRSIGIEPVVTREPGGTPFGEKIRELLLSPDMPDRGPLAELFLYSASRAELVEKVLLPEVEQGRLVICERYTDSTTVYQGIAGGLDRRAIELINGLATQGLVPDLTIVLDVVDPVIVRHRLSTRAKDKMESRDDSYHERVRAGYRELAHLYPSRVITINGEAGVDAVHSEIWRSVLELLRSHGYSV